MTSSSATAQSPIRARSHDTAPNPPYRPRGRGQRERGDAAGRPPEPIHARDYPGLHASADRSSCRGRAGQPRRAAAADAGRSRARPRRRVTPARGGLRARTRSSRARCCAPARLRRRSGSASRRSTSGSRPERRRSTCATRPPSAARPSSSSGTSPIAAGRWRCSRAARSRRFRRARTHSWCSIEGDLGPGPAQGLRQPRGGAGRRLRHRGGRGLRPARAERRGQDDDGRDPRGLPHVATRAR